MRRVWIPVGMEVVMFALAVLDELDRFEVRARDIETLEKTSTFLNAADYGVARDVG